MGTDPENPQINSKVYDFCVRAFRTTKKLLKLNIKLHQDDDSGQDTVREGNIFLFNHFARFETFIPQYLIHEATGAYCRSVAAAEFFDGDERFSQFLYSIGVVPNDLPNLFPFLARELLHPVAAGPKKDTQSTGPAAGGGRPHICRICASAQILRR